MLKVGNLGSGSAGNSMVMVMEDGGALLIDAGFSRREILARLAAIKIAPERLVGVVLTHEHVDHSRGCRVLCDTLKLPLYTTYGTAQYMHCNGMLPSNVLTFEPGNPFHLDNFDVYPFAVRHDAVDPVGFVVRAGGVSVGVATDLGEVNAVVQRYLHDCDALILESNYDHQMLLDSERRFYLKRRIAGRSGHLENKMTAGVLERLVTDRTRLLMLAHISRECNKPEIAFDCCVSSLESLGRSDVMVVPLRQEVPSQLYELEEVDV